MQGCKTEPEMRNEKEYAAKPSRGFYIPRMKTGIFLLTYCETLAAFF